MAIFRTTGYAPRLGEVKKTSPKNPWNPYPFIKLLRSITNGQAPRVLDNEIEEDAVEDKPALISYDKVVDPVIAGRSKDEEANDWSTQFDQWGSY